VDEPSRPCVARSVVVGRRAPAGFLDLLDVLATAFGAGKHLAVFEDLVVDVLGLFLAEATQSPCGYATTDLALACFVAFEQVDLGGSLGGLVVVTAACEDLLGLVAAAGEVLAEDGQGGRGVERLIVRAKGPAVELPGLDDTGVVAALAAIDPCPVRDRLREACLEVGVALNAVTDDSGEIRSLHQISPKSIRR
jgi:hypothetical protein